MYHLGSSFIGIVYPSELRDEPQQPLQKKLAARNDRKESCDDYEYDTRRFKYGGKLGPSYPFQLGKGFLDLRAYATKPVGFLVFRFSSVCHLLPHGSARNGRLRPFSRSK